jgi:hypothetical protein
VASPEVAESCDPEVLAVEGDGEGAVFEDFDADVGEAFGEVLVEVGTAGTVEACNDADVVVAEDGIDAEGGLELGDDVDDLSVVAVAALGGDVVAGEDDEVGFEGVDEVDAFAEVLGGDDAAAVEVGDLGEGFTGEFLGQGSHGEIVAGGFDPVGFEEEGVKCGEGGDGQGAGDGALEEGTASQAYSTRFWG